jgi:hypothetical protein
VARFRLPAATPDNLMMVPEPLPPQGRGGASPLRVTLASWTLESKSYGSGP